MNRVHITANLILEATRLLRQGRSSDAEVHLKKVLAREPSHLQAMWLYAELKALQGNLKGSVNWLLAVLAEAPDNTQVLRRLVGIYDALGDYPQSEAYQRRLITTQPGNASLHYNLGCLLQKSGNHTSAIDSYRRAIDLDSHFVQAYNNLGNTWFELDQYNEAAECYKQALHFAPKHLDATYNLALVFKNLDQIEEAIELFQHSLSISPDFTPAMLGLGTLHHDQNDLQNAQFWYEKAIAADPTNLDALYNLGTLHMTMERPEAALVCFRRALEAHLPSDCRDVRQSPISLSSQFSMVHFNLGRLYRRFGNTREWLKTYHNYRLPESDLHYLQYGLEVAVYEGNHDDADCRLLSLIQNLDRINDSDQISHLLSIVQYMEIQQSDLLLIYRRFNALSSIDTRGLRLSPDMIFPDSSRIRIGYLSPDFNRHVMGRIMLQVISRHNRELFDIRLFATSNRFDEITDEFRLCCDRFISLHGLSAKQAAQRIAAEDLHILVDLAGHTKGSVPQVLAYKPAPLQLTHLGYHGALGLDTVNYKVTDSHADLSDNSTYLIENLLPMEGCLIPLVRQSASLSSPSRAALGIEDNAIILGTFVTHRKLSRSCLSAWRAILEKTPNTILAFSTNKDSEKQAILNNLIRSGIKSERTIFIPYPSDPAEARARYRVVDLVLDTFPYSGGDTTLAAIDMEVPVITLCGERQSERVTYSILRNLGVTLGITHTVQEYVALACVMANDTTSRLFYVQEIKRKLAESSLADLDSYTRNLETAYQKALAFHIE